MPSTDGLGPADMASCWRYPRHLHTSPEDGHLTSFRLPTTSNLPRAPSTPSSFSVPPHTLAPLPTRTMKYQRGRPRAPELTSKRESSLVALPQVGGGEENERGWGRHVSKRDHCKVSDDYCCSVLARTTSTKWCLVKDK